MRAVHTYFTRDQLEDFGLTSKGTANSDFECLMSHMDHKLANIPIS
jgi:hypothetical protein